MEFRVRSEKNIYKRTGIKSLGNIPLNKINRELLIENNPKANIIKYIKDIRDNIINEIDGKTILVTSCNRKEGKSWVANNLAVSMARINKKVLLIDTNLREETNKDEVFYIEKGKGLSDFIVDIQENDKIGNLYKSKKYIKETQIPNLYVLQNGTISDESVELIKSKKMKKLLILMKDVFDFVILDGTTFFDIEEEIDLYTMVDTNIVVVENNKTTYNELKDLKEEIEKNKGNILGIILNKTHVKRGKYYAKENNQNLGIYIENKEENSEILLEQIIQPIIDKLQEKENKKFKNLQNEIKDDILIEDFINDIEVNFNMKLNNIEKENEKNISEIMKKISENEEKVNDKLDVHRYKIGKDINSFENFSEEIMKELINLKNDINVLKSKQENEQKEKNEIINFLIGEVKNKNYDEQIKNLLERIENIKHLEKNEEKIENDIVEQPKKKNNIINIGKSFIENRRNSAGIFSIYEPIKYEDLEKLAVEIVEFDDMEELIIQKR